MKQFPHRQSCGARYFGLRSSRIILAARKLFWIATKVSGADIKANNTITSTTSKPLPFPHTLLYSERETILSSQIAERGFQGECFHEIIACALSCNTRGTSGHIP